MAAAIAVATGAQAQRIEVVDAEGYGIPLVSIQTTGGTLLGTTDLNGVLADVKGAQKVALSHVAYKPQQVSMAALKNGRVTMETVDYGLSEVVVKPKPYLYVEYYFRAFSYIEDSLRAYAAGIIPVAHEVQEKFKGKTRTIWSYGGAANKALSWNIIDLLLYAEKGVKSAASPIEIAARTNKKFLEYYKTVVEPDGENHWIVKNPEEVVGQIVHANGLSRTTLDGGKMQIYANKANGENRMAKVREEKNYTYQYTEVYQLDEDGKVENDNAVMQLNHWEHDSKKGKKITILYLYATDKSYVDDQDFKARSKALNKGRSGDMSLDELAAYAQEHNIPVLAPEQQSAIRSLTKQTGKK